MLSMHPQLRAESVAAAVKDGREFLKVPSLGFSLEPVFLAEVSTFNPVGPGRLGNAHCCLISC